MNLHGIAAPIIGAINPNVTIPLKRSTGSTPSTAGKRVPTYDTLSGLAQIQAASNKDLAHLASLNIQGIFKSVYLYGNWYGIVRAGAQGGDLLTIDGKDWLVVMVPENWPDWTRVLVCQQLQ